MAMRHRSRLDQIIKYRKSIEEKQQIALAMIREKQYKEQEKMSRLHEAQREYQNQLKGEEGSSAFQLSCLDALSQKAFSRKAVIRQLVSQEHTAREELLEASKSRKIAEKLRDRQLERHKQHILKTERKYLDELATGRFIRARSQL